MEELRRYVSSPDAARYLGIKPQTLRVWRRKGRGPVYSRFSETPYGRVVYAIASLDLFLQERSHSGTSEEWATLACGRAA